MEQVSGVVLLHLVAVRLLLLVARWWLQVRLVLALAGLLKQSLQTSTSLVAMSQRQVQVRMLALEEVLREVQTLSLFPAAR